MKLSKGQSAAFKTAAIYACFGFLWITFSDKIAGYLVADKELLTLISIIKGWAYVAVTAALVYMLVTGYIKNIEKTEEKYRSVFDNTNDAIFILTPDNIVTDVNRAAAEMTKKSKADMTGKYITVFLKEEDNGAFIVSGSDETDSRIAVETEKISAEFGGSTNTILIASDITERKKHEKEMEKTMEELKSSNEELAQFSMLSSHDLKQPIRNLASFSELILRRNKGKIDQESENFLGIIKESAIQMNELINDVLAYSKAGRGRKETSSVIPQQFIKEAVDMLSRDYPAAKVIMNMDNIPAVKGDSNMLRQVAVNIIGNSFKFNKNSVPSVTVDHEDTEKEIKIKIRDNGIGIKSGYSEKIFQAFERLHTHEEFPGTGIGLAICRRIIERHGGRIWAESEGEGKGMTVIFTLPKE